MSITRLFHRPSGLWVDLADYPEFPPEGQAVIDACYRKITRRTPVLFCSHGQPVYLQRRPPRDALWAISMSDGHTHKPPNSTGMSEEHRRETDASFLILDRAGIPAAKERALPNRTKPDVTAWGQVHYGVEIQRAHNTRETAVDRTRRAIDGGLAFSVWVNDGLKIPRPRWEGRVPSLRLNSFNWAEEMPRPHQVTIASGLRLIEAKKCTPEFFDRCPQRNRRHCGKWHPRSRPWLQDVEIEGRHGRSLDSRGRFSYDTALVGIAQGMIVPLRFRGQEIILTSQKSITRYEELLGRPAELLFNARSEIRNLADPKDRDDDHVHRWHSIWPEIIRPEMCEQLVIPLPPPPRHDVRRGYCSLCGLPGRFYQYGWRCENHRPRSTRRIA